MRYPVVLLFGIVALGAATGARALPVPSLAVPTLRPPMLDLAWRSSFVPDVSSAVLPAIRGPASVPAVHVWVLQDGRAFWFSSGASVLVSLGTHALLGTSALVFGTGIGEMFALFNGPNAVPLLVGLGGAYMIVHALLAGTASWLVFNGTATVYESDFVTAVIAHVVGDLLGAAASGLVFGVGALLVGGLDGLAAFTGSAGIAAVGVFSVLGAIPAVVIAAIALVGAPALLSSWALAVSAHARPGYVVDPGWRTPRPPSVPPRTDGPATAPLLSIPLDG